jgi:predicted RNA-binding protein with PIN domain
VLILDTFNILHARRSPAWGVGALLAALDSGRYAGRDITLVCDGEVGARSAHEQAAITRLISGSRSRRVLHAGSHREADDLIEDLLAEWSAPVGRRAGGLIVVSTDRRVRAAALCVGAESLSAREFLDHLDADLAPRSRDALAERPAVDQPAVAWWINYFGLTTEVCASGSPADPGHKDARADAPLRSSAGRTSDLIPHSPPPIDPADLDMERWLRAFPAPRERPHA